MANMPTREMREYQARRRGSTPWKSLLEDAAIFVAYAAGEITEGRACRAAGLDRLELRRRYRLMLDEAARLAGVPIDGDERFATFRADAAMAGDGVFPRDWPERS